MDDVDAQFRERKVLGSANDSVGNPDGLVWIPGTLGGWRGSL